MIKMMPVDFEEEIRPRYVGRDVSHADLRQNNSDHAVRSRSLHHRHVTFGDMIHQILPHAGIDEDHFDHHDTDDQIRKVQHHHIHNRCNRVGKGVAPDDLEGRF